MAACMSVNFFCLTISNLALRDLSLEFICIAQLAEGEKLDITVNKKGGVILMPVKNPQAGWTDKFNAIADAEQDETLIDLVNEFDEDEWTW